MGYEVQAPDWGYWGKMGKARLIDALALTLDIDPSQLSMAQEDEDIRNALNDWLPELERRYDIAKSRLSEFAGVAAISPESVSGGTEISLREYRQWASGGWDDLPEPLRLNQIRSEVDKASELSGKSRNTVAKIIGGLLIKGHGIDIHTDRIEGLGDVMKDLESIGAGVSENVLREWIKLAREQIDPLKKTK